MEKSELTDDPSVIVTMTFRRPEHEEELRRVLNADRYIAVLWEMDRWLRHETKYGEDQARVDILREVRSRLSNFLENEGVDLEWI